MRIDSLPLLSPALLSSSLLSLQRAFTLEGSELVLSYMFPFLVLGPFNHGEMFFSSPAPRAESSLWHRVSLNSLLAHFSVFPPAAPVCRSHRNKAALAELGEAKCSGALINVL